MAEKFYGKGFIVNFSNGATEELFRIFIELAEETFPVKSSEKTLKFLRERLDLPDGGRAFILDDNCEVEDEVLLDLELIIKSLANKLSKPDVSIKSSTIVWDRELRLLWLAKIADLHSLISEYLKSKQIFVEPLNVDLPKDDEITFERQRLLNLFRNKRGDNQKTKEKDIEIYEKIIDLSEQDSKSLKENDLALIYLEYVNLLNEKEHKTKLIETWTKFLHIAQKNSDEESIVFAKQYLENLVN